MASALIEKLQTELVQINAKLALIESSGKGKKELAELKSRKEFIENLLSDYILTTVTITQKTPIEPVVEFQETQVPLSNGQQPTTSTTTNSSQFEVQDPIWVAANLGRVLTRGQGVFLTSGGYYLGNDVTPVGQLPLLGDFAGITGSTIDYYLRGDKTFANFGASVRGTKLAGYAVSSGSITEEDTVKSAIEKLAGRSISIVANRIAYGAPGTGEITHSPNFLFVDNVNEFSNRSILSVAQLTIGNAGGDNYIQANPGYALNYVSAGGHYFGSGLVNIDNAGVCLRVNSTNDNTNKIALMGLGVVRSYIGASSSQLFVITNNLGQEAFSFYSDGSLGFGNNSLTGLITHDGSFIGFPKNGIVVGNTANLGYTTNIFTTSDNANIAFSKPFYFGGGNGSTSFLSGTSASQSHELCSSGGSSGPYFRFTNESLQGAGDGILTIFTTTSGTSENWTVKLLNKDFYIKKDLRVIGNIQTDTQIGTTDRMVQVDANGIQSASSEIVDAWITDATTITNIENPSNWTGVNYTGPALTNVYQGQQHYNATYKYTCPIDNIIIRTARV